MSYRISILDKSPLAAGETPRAQALARTLTLAQHAEARATTASGSLNTTIPISWRASPELVIARLLGHTRRIRLGSGGVMLQHYSP